MNLRLPSSSDEDMATSWDLAMGRRRNAAPAAPTTPTAPSRVCPSDRPLSVDLRLDWSEPVLLRAWVK